jgi:hypothetical protein
MPASIGMPVLLAIFCLALAIAQARFPRLPR